ncbi:hypothetical protein A2U01_0109131, partial [Trifolium medium]|nr:hypothetical protein [Trifolium medium]
CAAAPDCPSSSEEGSSSGSVLDSCPSAWNLFPQDTDSAAIIFLTTPR